MTSRIFCSRSTGIWFLTICLFIAYQLHTIKPTYGNEIYQPSDDEYVIAKVLPARQAWQSSSLPDSLKTAKTYIKQGSITGNERYFSYARAMLRPWWDSNTSDVLLLKAQILQHEHKFNAALMILNQLISEKKQVQQAILQRAYLNMVMGNVTQASRDCLSLITLASPVISATCLSQAKVQQGNAKQLYNSLASLYDAHHSLSDTEQYELEYTLTLIACHFLESSHPSLSKSWREKLIKNPTITLEGKLLYFDCLLNIGDFEQLLADTHQLNSQLNSQHTSIVLRKAIALKALNKRYENETAQLERYFETKRLRKDSLVSREYALYLTHFDKDIQQAARIAFKNWQQQKLPADTQLALQLAQQTQQHAFMTQINHWLRPDELPTH